jgi:hypothetical protein
MSGLPPNMDCSLLGSDNKEGTVPMAVVPFSNRMYIYIISSSLFAIFSAIIFYVFLKPTTPPTNPPKIISIITAIIGITSVVLYNLYNNTPATFNFLFFGMMGIIITFCLLVYLIIRNKYYLIELVKIIGEGIITVIGKILSVIGNILYFVLNWLWKKVQYVITQIKNIKFNDV